MLVNFFRAQTNFFLKCPEKILRYKKKKMLEIFKQRQPSENCLFLDLETFQKKFYTVFTNLKSSVEGKNAFFSRFLVCVSWIGTLNANGTHLPEKILGLPILLLLLDIS